MRPHQAICRFLHLRNLPNSRRAVALYCAMPHFVPNLHLMPTNPWPPAFESRIRQQLGHSADAFFAALEQSPPTSIRLNPAKPADRFASADEVPWCPYGRYLAERPSFAADPLIFAGAYYVQEASSMALWQAISQTLGDQPAPLVLDLCAAPGGKSTLIASLIGQDGLLVANEVDGKRIAALSENLVRWGAPNVVLTQSPAHAFESLGEIFDLILIDAPCSGEGMFRKDPKAVQVWHEKFPTTCSITQKQLAESALQILKPGGTLIYSTCTFAEQEDEQILDALLSEYPMMTRPINGLTEFGVEEVQTKAKATAYRFWPHKIKGEGFFLAALQKEQRISARQAKPGKAKGRWDELPKKYRSTLQPWLQHGERFAFFAHQDMAYALPAHWATTAKKLANSLRVNALGIEMGKMQKQQLFPAHALGMSTALTDQIARWAVSLENAHAYLQKHEPQLDQAPPPGWGLITYEGHGLGWAKALPNRINNHYPAKLRLKKTFDASDYESF